MASSAACSSRLVISAQELCSSATRDLKGIVDGPGGSLRSSLGACSDNSSIGSGAASC